MSIKKYMLFLFIAVILVGCSTKNYPDYLVLLNKKNSDYSRCAGSMLSETTVLTAQHCAKYNVVLTDDGQMAMVKRILLTDTNHDQVILELHTPIFINSYAEIGEFNKSLPAILYGACPKFFIGTPKVVFPMESEIIGVLADNKIKYLSTYRFESYSDICGGDSGGPITQGGKIVGIVNAINSETLPLMLPYGKIVYGTTIKYIYKRYCKISGEKC